MKVSPSIIAADFMELKDVLKKLEESQADYIHLDIMDGVFVNNLTFGPDIAAQILKGTELAGDTHLMIKNPEKYVEQFLDTGTEILTFHIESEGNKERIIDRVKQRGRKVGITLNPSTPLSAIEPFLDRMDLVLIMTVYPGFYGQKFEDEMLKKMKDINEIRSRRGYDFLIEVDGGINADTAPRVAPYVDIMVSGSFILKSSSIEERISFLKQL